MIERRIARQLSRIDLRELLAERYELLVLRLLGLRPHVGQSTQRLAIAFLTCRDRIDLPAEGLVVRNDLL